MAQTVKRAFNYRFYPTDEQAAELSHTFGCVRLVYNRALEERTRAWYGEQRRISYVQSSAALTQWIWQLLRQVTGGHVSDRET